MVVHNFLIQRKGRKGGGKDVKDRGSKMNNFVWSCTISYSKCRMRLQSHLSVLLVENVDVCSADA